jgi:hypothetical protein
VSRRDTEIRARLAEGDEDSVINFLLFGVSFTTQPRITEGEMLMRVSRTCATSLTIALATLSQRRRNTIAWVHGRALRAAGRVRDRVFWYQRH